MGGEPSFDAPGLGVPTEEAIREMTFPTARPGAASVDDVQTADLAPPEPITGVNNRPGVGGNLGARGSVLGEAAVSIGNKARSIVTPSNSYSFGLFDALATALTWKMAAPVKILGSLLGSEATKLAPETVLGKASIEPDGSVSIASPIAGFEYKSKPGFVTYEPVPDADVAERMAAGLTEAEARGEIPYDPDRTESVEGPPEGGYPEGLFDPLTEEELEDEREMTRRGRWSLIR